MKPLLAVLGGGVLGTGLRLMVDVLLPHGGRAFPIGTLIVNILGSFLLAALVARFWPRAPGWLRAGLGPGLLGSFTTFSALTVSVVDLTEAGAGITGLLYLAASLVGGIAAAVLGIRLGAPAAAVPPIGDDE